MLSDAGNDLAARFGLRFSLPEDLRSVYTELGAVLPRFNGDDSWTLPIPARFIIDPSGIIRMAEADPDYTRRPDPARTLEALEAIGKDA